MNRETTVPLDSVRLARYAVGVPCYVCEQDNTFDAELCRHCFAPMALAHQANSQNIHPRMVATIGPSAVGKTVYLGMLMDMLSKQSHGLQVLARGAFSITLQQQTIAALSRCEFPNKTPNEPDRWNWVHCQTRGIKQKRPTELIMPDMAGEAILEEVDHPNSYPVIRAFLEKCTGLIVLIDGTRVHGGTSDQDYFTMKLLSYLLELQNDPKLGWPSKPVALVFSKGDRCEAVFDDPAAYARQHTPGLWKYCQERFRRHQFFAAGVAGACAYRNVDGSGRVPVPLRIEPRGVVEPFEWLMHQIKG
jgi:hypothetical protein